MSDSLRLTIASPSGRLLVSPRRPAISDSALCAAIDEWIVAFAPGYAGLLAQDWSAEEEQADAVVELELPAEVPRRWESPVATRVVAKDRGDVEPGSELFLRLAPGGDEPFNGMLIHVLPRERWRTCARFAADGSVLPSDGTRRIAAAPARATAAA